MKKPLTLRTLILNQNILMILLLTIAVIIIWVGFSIYFSYSKTTITQTDASLIAPLTPKLDSSLFSTLKQRKTWSDADLASFTPSISLTDATTSDLATPRPTPIPTPLKIASASATPISSASATTP